MWLTSTNLYKIVKLSLAGLSRKCLKNIFSFTGSLVRVSSCQLSSSGKANKELLAKLRKETGFPFSKCQTALITCSNDFAKAFAWLEEQSKKEGWKKAEKVKGRQTSHGLIGAVVRDNIAAMVEVRVSFLN